tara:strand:+ start:7672 stop:7821 length:150 start_codon:yes stop_codon:yes gene_type:complete
MNWRDFFKSFGESYLHPRFCGEQYDSMTIEQLYQAFRARMQDEDKDDLK